MTGTVPSSTVAATSRRPFRDEATRTRANAADLAPGAHLRTPDGTTATVTATRTYHDTVRFKGGEASH
ncbi:hypothetical protein [Streptomyces hoynatensis]|uniref:hypothetical protein n=1 Tax=Streptomyces hoynatensis TaxID=1141874 RepID=UPI0011C3A00A|nr:hypothetical protein [Streptomyces hoynatensis]